MIEVFLPIGTLTRRVNNYVSRQGKGMNTGNESSIISMIFVYDCTSLIDEVCITQLTVID